TGEVLVSSRASDELAEYAVADTEAATRPREDFFKKSRRSIDKVYCSLMKLIYTKCRFGAPSIKFSQIQSSRTNQAPSPLGEGPTPPPNAPKKMGEVPSSNAPSHEVSSTPK